MFYLVNFARPKAHKDFMVKVVPDHRVHDRRSRVEQAHSIKALPKFQLVIPQLDGPITTPGNKTPWASTFTLAFKHMKTRQGPCKQME